MADGDFQGGNDQTSSQLVTVGQNLVVALNNLNNTVGETFPQFVSAPASATADGVAGNVAFDTSYFYVCVSSNVWKRVTLSTF